MNLQDLLREADPEEVVRAQIVDRFDDPYSDEQKLSFEEKVEVYSRFIKKLCYLEAEPNPEQNVLLCNYCRDTYMEEGDGIYLDVSMYPRKDVEEKAALLQVYINFPEEDISDEEANRLWDECSDKLLPSGYAFEFSKWEEVLGWDVCLANIERIGVYKFLSAVLYEMSRCVHMGSEMVGQCGNEAAEWAFFSNICTLLDGYYRLTRPCITIGIQGMR